MKASVITIGDEILIGQILDTNTQWIANQLHDLGVELVETVSISDTKKAIIDGVKHAMSIADLIIVTGGLGPTKDDVTKYTLTDFFEDELALNSEVLEHIKQMFSARGIPFKELNEAQAMLPKKAKILHNAVGTAAGMWFEKQGKIVISLPGVPYEMKNLITHQVLPKLQDIGGFPAQSYQTYVLYGLGESSAATLLESFENQLPEYVKLAYLPSPGRVRLRLTGSHVDRGVLEKELAVLGKKLELVFKDYSFMVGDVDYLDIVKSHLSTSNKSLSVAESCTGGKLAEQITKTPGASSYFLGGVVAYNQSLKTKVLGVSQQTIDNHSVVSAEVAKEMALGVQKLTNSNFAMATTGNAGPTSDDTEEKVGVVFIAIATENQILVEKFNFGQPRVKVIEHTKNKAFEMLAKEILKNH